MRNKILFIILGLLLFSCSEETTNDNQDWQTGIGEVWLSGGLFFCAEQIHMQNGDTLIPVNIEKIMVFQSGQKINVKYKELEICETNCTIGKDCEILEIQIIE
jgi:hypothetical protein